jgi:hypothetical protein
VRALSSAGRASHLHCECRGFDPLSAHKIMSLIKQITYFSILPPVIFGVVLFLLGWYGGVSVTKSEADLPYLGINNFPFTDLAVNFTKVFSVAYLIFGIVYALMKILQRSRDERKRLDLARVFVMVFLGGFTVTLSSFIALFLLSIR